MIRLIRKLRKSFFVMMVFFAFLSQNNLLVKAQENSEDKVLVEFYEKKAAGLEVYELVDDSGKIVGYYEPYSESNPAPNKEIMPLYTSRINWTIEADHYAYGDNRYTIGNGDTMTIDISQSVSGKSMLRFENHTSGKGLLFLLTETTDGWHGTITFRSIETAVYSFGILNQSDSTITYTGNYSL